MGPGGLASRTKKLFACDCTLLIAVDESFCGKCLFQEWLPASGASTLRCALAPDPLTPPGID